MSVKIRLRRTGRKKQPSYRLVVADSATPRDGQYLDALGTYNPLVKPADLRIDLEKVEKWLAEGAQMSGTVASLVRKARQGGDSKVAVRGVGPEEKPEVGNVVAAAEPSAPAPAGSRGAPKAETAEPTAASDAASSGPAPTAEPTESAAPAESAPEEPAASAEPAAPASADSAEDGESARAPE